MATTLSERLVQLGACDEAVGWASEYAAETAWAECRRGDWMLWVLGRCDQSRPWTDERKPLVACALECALLAKKHWPKSYRLQIADAVAVIQKWTRGKASADDVKAARRQLWSAATAADAAAAYAAAYAATAAAAATAATAAADAAAYAADAAARKSTLAACADIVRRPFPNPPQHTG